MDTDDLVFLHDKKVLGVGYEKTLAGYTLILVIKGKEVFITSETPMELDVMEIH